MNDQAKIHLSTLEMELVNNKEWIFTKKQIIDKVYLLFGDLHHSYRKIIEDEKQFFTCNFSKAGW